MDRLTYNGFFTHSQYCKIDHVYYGKIENIDDLVSWQSDSIFGIRKAFIEAVEDYIETCKEINKKI